MRSVKDQNGKSKPIESISIDTSTKTSDDLDFSNIPPDLMNTLLPFQVKSIEYAGELFYLTPAGLDLVVKDVV